MTGKPGSGNSGCSAASEHGNNQNSLRDRIAAVLMRDAFGPTTQTAALRQADAVIRELGLDEAQQDCRCQLRHLSETPND